MKLTYANPMTKTLALTLIFEVIVAILAIPGAIMVAGSPVAVAMVAGIGVAIVCAVAGLNLRHDWGWWAGWVAQILMVALGLITPWMYVVGGGFALLYLVIFVLGRRIGQMDKVAS